MATQQDPHQSEPHSVDSLIHAKWIIPVVPFAQVFEDCSIAIHRGLIDAIVPKTEAEKRYQAREVFDLDQHVVIPGLINAHGHSGMSLMRGFADDLALEQWLQQFIWPAESQWVSEEFVADGCRLAMAEMIRSGTTSFSDMYFFPNIVASNCQQAGMRCQVYSPILDFPTVWAQTADEYIHKALAVHDDFRSSNVVTTGFGPHAPYTVSDAPLERIATLAEELQAGVHIHVHETALEVSEAIERHGRRPLERLRQLGLVSPLLQCVHMTQVDDADIELLQSHGAHVVHCPESNLKLASGFCPVTKLMQANVNVALGTDSTASNNDLDLFGEMHTAALLAKGFAQDATALNAHQVLRMATLNGAIANGIEQLVGSLEVGKAADLCAVALNDLETQPMFNAISQLIYTQNGHRVSDVWVNGKALLRNRRLQTLNEEEIIKRARHWRGQLNERAYHGN